MASRLSSPAFVGREPELARLADLVEDARGGRPGFAVVAGEAGIGKSRLVRETEGLARRSGIRVLSGGCLPLAGDPIPYAPFIEALRPLPELLEPSAFETLIGDWRAELAS